MHDILTFKVTEHKIQIQNGEVRAFRAKQNQKSGARQFTSSGEVVSASYVGEIADEVLLTNCQKNAAAALPAEAVPTGKAQKKWQIPFRSGRDEAVEAAGQQIAFWNKSLPDFIINGQVTQASNFVRYTDSNGTDLQLERPSYGFFYDLRRKGSPNIADGFIFHSSATGFHSMDNLKWTTEQFQAFDHKVEIPAGKHKVLMCPDARTLEKIGESLSADRYAEGSALYSARKSDKIFSDLFSLSDLRWVPERNGFKPFDYEGTIAPAPAVPLIERGVFTSLISDLKNQKRHGIPSTGNGFRNYNSSVKLQFANLALEPGRRSFREILRDAGTVIICNLAIGGDLTAQGDFSTPVQLAFLVKDGVVAGRLPAIAISSRLERMYGSDLLEVASDGAYSDTSDPYVLCEMDVQVI